MEKLTIKCMYCGKVLTRDGGDIASQVKKPICLSCFNKLSFGQEKPRRDG